MNLTRTRIYRPSHAVYDLGRTRNPVIGEIRWAQLKIKVTP